MDDSQAMRPGTARRIGMGAVHGGFEARELLKAFL
jgi:hypothetical protein